MKNTSEHYWRRHFEEEAEWYRKDIKELETLQQKMLFGVGKQL